MMNDEGPAPPGGGGMDDPPQPQPQSILPPKQRAHRPSSASSNTDASETGSNSSHATVVMATRYVTFARNLYLASRGRAREEISDARAMATEREAHRSHSPAIRNFLPGSYERRELSSPTKGGKWVRFDESSSISTDIGAPEIPASPSHSSKPAADVAQIDVVMQEEQPPRHFETRQVAPAAPPGGKPPNVAHYENGKLISSIIPENQLCPWIIPASFNAYKMPKSLISDQLAMPVEDYVTAMEMLTNDFRFRSYTVCYRRLIVGWLILAFLILIALLLCGAKGVILFVIVLAWLFLVAVGILVCLCIKKQINKGLHRCVRSVNGLLMKHDLMVGIEDTGKLSCHKIAIHFVYFKTNDCLPKIMQMLSQQDQRVAAQTGTAVPSVSIEIDRPGMPPMTTNEERGGALIMKYSQSYVKALVRKTIRFPSRPAEGVSEFSPLHCTRSYCLCQYMQKHHFERKAKKWYQRFF